MDLVCHEQSKIHPSSIYGINKQQQEQMVMLMGESLSIPSRVRTTICRLFFAVGGVAHTNFKITQL